MINLEMKKAVGATPQRAKSEFIQAQFALAI